MTTGIVKQLLAATGLALASLALPASAALTALVGGSVVNLDNGAALDNAVVLVDGERIAAVGSRGDVAIPADARVIDASGKWIVPGLMNMHVHLGLKLPGAASMALQHESEAELALRMAENGRLSLLSGTTTIRAPGDRGHAIFAVDKAIRRGEIPGPRIHAAGLPLAPTGGHGTSHGEVGVDGPDEVTRMAREQISAGATWLKLMISKGIASPAGSIAASDMTLEEMRAAVDVAHRAGFKVTAHSGSPEATLEALEAGVDCFEHGYYLNQEVFRKMKRAGAWYVPTIVVSQVGALEFFQKIGSPQWYLDRAASVGKVHWKALQTAIDEGVNIAMGSDQFPFEPNEGTVASVREIELYVDAGMTPLRALRSATVETARLLGVEGEVGTISEGKYADLLLLESNPIADISALRSIGLVMKGGAVVRNDWNL